jgi:hypothetical protein
MKNRSNEGTNNPYKRQTQISIHGKKSHNKITISYNIIVFLAKKKLLLWILKHNGISLIKILRDKLKPVSLFPLRIKHENS